MATPFAHGVRDLDRCAARCDEPSCQHPHDGPTTVPMILGQQCHDRAGAFVSYFQGFVFVRCRRCDTLILVIRPAVDGIPIPEDVWNKVAKEG